jgi:hypothetical protein
VTLLAYNGIRINEALTADSTTTPTNAATAPYASSAKAAKPPPNPSPAPLCDPSIGTSGTDRAGQFFWTAPGREDQLKPIYDRLRQLGIDEPDQAARTVEHLTGRPAPARQASYRERRKRLLLALLDDYTDGVDRAAEQIGVFFDHLRQVGVRGLVAEQLDDADYLSQSDLSTAASKPKRPPKD